MERVAICDDDQSCIKLLHRQVKSFAKKMNIDINVVEYSSGTNLLFDWADPKVHTDILYLDIHMPGASGIEVAEKLREDGCNAEIIFYTKSSPEVFGAFDVDAFHYILKGETPIDKQEAIFRRAIQKSREKSDEVITFSCAGEHRTIKIKDIKYFTVEVRVLTVHYGDGKTFDFYSTLDKIGNILSSKGFLRLNRGILINMAYVESRTKAEVIMQGNRVFTIGTRYRQVADKELTYYLKEDL
jgi:DNA-binding LytR/AlgR family response regulator